MKALRHILAYLLSFMKVDMNVLPEYMDARALVNMIECLIFSLHSMNLHAKDRLNELEAEKKALTEQLAATKESWDILFRDSDIACVELAKARSEYKRFKEETCTRVNELENNLHEVARNRDHLGAMIIVHIEVHPTAHDELNFFSANLIDKIHDGKREEAIKELEEHGFNTLQADRLYRLILNR